MRQARDELEELVSRENEWLNASSPKSSHDAAKQIEDYVRLESKLSVLQHPRFQISPSVHLDLRDLRYKAMSACKTISDTKTCRHELQEVLREVQIDCSAMTALNGEMGDKMNQAYGSLAYKSPQGELVLLDQMLLNHMAMNLKGHRPSYYTKWSIGMFLSDLWSRTSSSSKNSQFSTKDLVLKPETTLRSLINSIGRDLQIIDKIDQLLAEIDQTLGRATDLMKQSMNDDELKYAKQSIQDALCVWIEVLNAGLSIGIEYKSFGARLEGTKRL